jgi:hypothetical protein
VLDEHEQEVLGPYRELGGDSPPLDDPVIEEVPDGSVSAVGYEAEYGADSAAGDVFDPDESTGIVSGYRADRPGPPLEGLDQADRVAAGEQVDESGPEFAEDGPPPIRELIEKLSAAATALRGVVDLLSAAGVAEVIAAQAAGHASSIDIHRVEGLRPGLERALGQLAAMQESAGAGSLPAQGETMELAVHLTAAGETADQVQREIPGSSRWRFITRGIKRAVRATGQILTAVARSVEAVKLSAGVNILVIHLDAEVAWKAPPQEPRVSSGGAAPGS